MDIVSAMGLNQMSGLDNIAEKSTTKVIAVTGGKGGVGKTNISVNLALALAKKNKRVMLFDADLSLANIDVLLGLNVDKNLSHVLSGDVDLQDIIVNGPEGIKVVPASSGIQRMCELTELEQMGIIQAFSEITTDIDYLLVDTAAGISSEVVSFIKASQEIIMVVCNEPTSMTDAYATIKILSRDYGIKDFQLIANMVTNPYEGKKLFNKLYRVAEKFLDVQLSFLGAVPFDTCVRKSVQRQQAVINAYPCAKATEAILKIRDQLLEQPNTIANQGNIAFFLEKLLDNEAILLGA